jgi:hypothetical protein
VGHQDIAESATKTAMRAIIVACLLHGMIQHRTTLSFGLARFTYIRSGTVLRTHFPIFINIYVYSTYSPTLKSMNGLPEWDGRERIELDKLTRELVDVWHSLPNTQVYYLSPKALSDSSAALLFTSCETTHLLHCIPHQHGQLDCG